MERLPQVGQILCHYESRIAYEVVKCRRKKGDGAVVVTVVDCQTRSQVVHAPLSSFDEYPEPGDVVLVAFGVYQRWIYRQMAAVRGSGKTQPKAYTDLEARLYDVDWLTKEFVFRRIEEGLALIQGGGTRRQVPIECLRVLKKQEVQRATAS